MDLLSQTLISAVLSNLIVVQEMIPVTWDSLFSLGACSVAVFLSLVGQVFLCMTCGWLGRWPTPPLHLLTMRYGWLFILDCISGCLYSLTAWSSLTVARTSPSCQHSSSASPSYCPPLCTSYFISIQPFSLGGVSPENPERELRTFDLLPVMSQFVSCAFRTVLVLYLPWETWEPSDSSFFVGLVISLWPPLKRLPQFNSAAPCSWEPFPCLCSSYFLCPPPPVLSHL